MGSIGRINPGKVVSLGMICRRIALVNPVKIAAGQHGTVGGWTAGLQYIIIIGAGIGSGMAGKAGRIDKQLIIGTVTKGAAALAGMHGVALVAFLTGCSAHRQQTYATNNQPFYQYPQQISTP